MSRAFVKEEDGDQVADEQPELPVSEHKNFMTPRGLDDLRQRQQQLAIQQRQLKDTESIADKLTLGQIGRELRYVDVRISTAVIVTEKNLNKVCVGASVSIIDDNGDSYQFVIVGEDEADVNNNKISWVSPLAKALLGCEVGEEVTWCRPVGDLVVELVSISYE